MTSNREWRRRAEAHPPRDLTAEFDPLLEFNPPPGWPTPARYWVEGNAGFEPPAGWVPVPGLPPAPEGWVFWSINHDVWAMDSAHGRKQLNDSALAGALILVAGSVGLIFDFVADDSPALFSVAWLALILIGAVGLARYSGRLRALTTILVRGTSIGAGNRRVTHDNSAYLDYLREVQSARPADDADTPMNREQFARARADAAWTTQCESTTAADERMARADLRSTASVLAEHRAVAISWVGRIVAIVVIVFAMSTLMRTVVAGSGAGPVANTAQGFSVVPFPMTEAGDYGCSYDFGCFTFQLVTDQECPSGYMAVVHFTDLNGGPASDREYFVNQLGVSSPGVLVAARAQDAKEIADVRSLRCYGDVGS